MKTFQYTHDHTIIITNDELQYEDSLNNFNDDCIKLGLKTIRQSDKWFVVELGKENNLLNNSSSYFPYIENVSFLLEMKTEREINQLPAPWLRK